MWHEKRFGKKCPGCGVRLEFDENFYGKCFHCLQEDKSLEEQQIEECIEPQIQEYYENLEKENS